MNNVLLSLFIISIFLISCLAGGFDSEIPLPTSTFPAISGGLYTFNDTCPSHLEIGAISIQTDLCLLTASQGKYFQWWTNGSHIVYRSKCLNNNCSVECTDVIYKATECNLYQIDQVGRDLYFRLNWAQTWMVPQLQKGWTKFNVTNWPTIGPQSVTYQQRVIYSGCFTNRTHSRSQVDDIFLFQDHTVQEFESDNCIGDVTRSKSFTHLSTYPSLDTNFESEENLILVEGVVELPTNVVLSANNVLADIHFENTCFSNASKGGVLLLAGNVASRPNEGFYDFYTCNSTFITQRRCTNLEGTLNCRTRSEVDFSSPCQQGLKDEQGITFYIGKFRCSPTIPNIVGGQIWSDSCTVTDGSTGFRRFTTPGCIDIVPPLNDKPFHSRMTGCVNGTTFVREYDTPGCSGGFNLTGYVYSLGICNTDVDPYARLDLCQMSSSLIVHTCYGVSPQTPSVCSGNGDCIGPNNCQCRSPFTGVICDKIPTNTAFNLTTNLTGSLMNIGSGSSISITGMNLVMTNSTLNVGGSMTISSGTINMAGTKMNIQAGGSLTISANAQIIGDDGSTLESSGSISIRMGSGTTSILVAIVNSGSFEISGAGNINLTNSISQSDSGSFTSLDSNITVTGELKMQNGFVNLGGKLTANVVSLTDTFLRTPKGLNLVGSLNLNSTALFEVSSSKDLNALFVSNVFSLYSTIILKLTDGFSPQIGDELNIIPSASDFQIKGNFYLIGGATKTGLRYEIGNSTKTTGNPNGDFAAETTSKNMKIVVTYSISDVRATCHYLGNGKNFEFHQMEKQTSFSFIVATPRNEMNYAIGWNSNSTLNKDHLVVFTNGSSKLQTKRNFLIDSVVKSIPQVFGVGPSYLYINIIIPRI